MHRLYRAKMMQEVMKRLHASFIRRSKGGTDDLGNKWKPLKPATHAYKPFSRADREFQGISGRRERGLLTPSQNRMWKGIYARTLKRLQKRGVGNPEKQAAEKAWAVLKGKGARTLIGLGRITDINVRTGRLKAATRPGSIANNRYYPPRDQVINIGVRGGSRITFRVPYLGKVDAVRPVVPANITKWIEQAHEVAIVEAKALYERIQSNTNSTRRRTKGRPSNRNKRPRN